MKNPTGSLPARAAPSWTARDNAGGAGGNARVVEVNAARDGLGEFLSPVLFAEGIGHGMSIFRCGLLLGIMIPRNQRKYTYECC